MYSTVRIAVRREEAIGEKVLAALGVAPLADSRGLQQVDLAESSKHWFPEEPRRSDAVAAVSTDRTRAVDRLLEMSRIASLMSGAVMQLEIPHDQASLAARLHEVAEHSEQPRRTRDAVQCMGAEGFVHLFDAVMLARSRPASPVPAGGRATRRAFDSNEIGPLTGGHTIT